MLTFVVFISISFCLVSFVRHLETGSRWLGRPKAARRHRRNGRRHDCRLDGGHAAARPTNADWLAPVGAGRSGGSAGQRQQALQYQGNFLT